jgi:alpha-ribazole phosphatase/probable phosphoglycerate mutase
MTDIYISRHGITESNKKKIYAGRSDERLSPEGRVQTENLGRTIQCLGINRIYSSPVQRALETAQIISQILNIPVEIENELAEMKLGAWAGLTEDEVSERFLGDYQLWNTRPAELVLPERETLREIQERALRVISHINKKSDGSSVLIVTHVAIVRCLIIHYQRLDINLYRRIDVPNASVFRLQWDGDYAAISRFL